MKSDKKARYLKSHEWVRKEEGFFLCGLSDYAQSQVGEIVYVELPEVGAQFDQGAAFGVIESVKAASDIFFPLSGKIIEINSELQDAPELVNGDPFGKGWICKIEARNESEFESLLSESDYVALLESES